MEGAGSMNIESNLWKLYVYKFFSSFWLIAPILIPFFESNGLSATQVFIVQATYSLSALIFEIPSGYLSDRIGRKKTLIIGSFLLPVGVAVYAFSNSFMTFVLAEFILAVSGSMHSGTDSALIYDTLVNLEKENKYKKVEGRAQSIQSIGVGTASILGGLFALITIRFPFYVNIATASILFPLSLLMVEPARKKLKSKNHLREILRISKYSIKHPKILSVILYSSLILSTCIIGVWTYYLYYGELGLSVFYYGFLFFIFGLVSAFGSGIAHRIEKKIGLRLSFILIMLISFVFIGLGLIKSLYMIPAIMLIAFIWGFSSPLFMECINKIINSDIRATVLSVNHMVGRTWFVILAPIIGKLIDMYSLGFAHICLGVFFLVIGIVSVFMLIRNKVV
jgi:MFS family permease